MECGPRALKGLIDAEITVVAFVVIAVNVCVVVKSSSSSATPRLPRSQTGQTG